MSWQQTVTFPIQRGICTGGTFLPNGEIVICVADSEIIRYNTSYQQKDNFYGVNHGVNDITALNNNMVATTNPEETCLTVLEERSATHSTRTHRTTDGTYISHGGNLIWYISYCKQIYVCGVRRS
jgi:hypothetical protein